MILPVIDTTYWWKTHHKQVQIDYEITQEKNQNISLLCYQWCNNKANKYKNLLKVRFKITQMWTHGMVTSKMGPFQDGVNICSAKKYLKSNLFS